VVQVEETRYGVERRCGEKSVERLRGNAASSGTVDIWTTTIFSATIRHSLRMEHSSLGNDCAGCRRRTIRETDVPRWDPVRQRELTYILFTAAAKPQEAKAKLAKKAALKGTQSKSLRKIRTTTSFHRPATLKLRRNPKYARKSIPHLPRMDQFRVIQHPLNTESAMKKIEDNNTLVFIVDLKSNKRQIKDAVKKLYDVEAAKIRTLIR
jgi:large subunit ribosomal protein L23Ae